MTIDVKQAKHIAQLARLALTEDEIIALSAQLAAMVRYVETLGEVDTTGVEPMSHVEECENELRPDVPGAALERSIAIHLAPHSDGESFSVPQVIGSKEPG